MIRLRVTREGTTQYVKEGHNILVEVPPEEEHTEDEHPFFELEKMITNPHPQKGEAVQCLGMAWDVGLDGLQGVSLQGRAPLNAARAIVRIQDKGGTGGGPDRKSTASKGDGSDTYGNKKSKGSLKRP